MEILYITNFTEPKTYWKIVHESKIKPAGSASQNFEGLLLKGFFELEDLDVTACSFRLVPSYPGHGQVLWKGYNEELFNNVTCTYLSFINLPILKQLCFSIGLIPIIIKWTIKNRSEQKAILFTCINIPMVFSAFFLRIFLKYPVVAIVPDLPSLVLDYTELNRFKRLLKYPYKWLAKVAEYRFDGYVFLTEPMNKVINHKHRPYIIVEGITDSDINNKDKLKPNSPKFGVMYAGALYRKFGIETLIKGVIRTNNKNIELWLFGAGDMETEIIHYAGLDSRIKFFGLRPREEVIQAELNALLLINPRPSKQEFTEFSFPSKILEYMATGTPVITTRLPGIPPEYFNYTFVLDDETEEGIAYIIELLLQMPQYKLDEFGQRARQFVLENKNNRIQAKKIFDLIKKVIPLQKPQKAAKPAG